LYIIQEHKEVLKYNAINNTVNRIIRRKKISENRRHNSNKFTANHWSFLFKDAQ